jgi:serine O-acetyltransferase
MNGALPERKPDDFGLIAYLAADLRRAGMLQHGSAPQGLKLWLGIASPRFAPVLLCRLAHRLYRWRLGPLAKLVSLFNFFLFGIEIAVRCPIGKGVFFPHTQGTVIGAQAIGENAIIFQGVTLGARELDFSYGVASRPVLGNNVTVGAGAKVLGPVTLGDGARVGANAVVLDSIPAGTLAVGAPAKPVIRRSGAQA